MACNYTEGNRDQLYLLPASMKEGLPEDHLAWFLLDAVGRKVCATDSMAARYSMPLWIRQMKYNN